MSKQLGTRLMFGAGSSPAYYYWELHNSGTEATEHDVLPSPYVQLVFPLRHAITVHTIKQPLERPFYVPLLDSSKKITLARESKIFGIHLDPVVATSMSEYAPSELCRNANSLEDVYKKGYRERIIEIVYSSDSFEERVSRLEHFFEQNTDVCEETLKVVLSMTRQAPTAKLSLIARDAGYSERWIQKKLKDIVGVTFCELVSILRFNLYIENMYRFKDCSLTDNALKSGYYDQAHAIREFNKLAGVTPGRFFKNLPEFNMVINKY